LQPQVRRIQVQGARRRPHGIGRLRGAPDRQIQALIELAPEDFRFDPSYPDLVSPRDQDFVLIEILWSVGRSVKVKRKLMSEFMALLADSGLSPERVMVFFKETAWENWAFDGGRVIHG